MTKKYNCTITQFIVSVMLDSYQTIQEKEIKKQQEIVIKKDSASFNEYKYDAKEKGNNEYQKKEKKNSKKEKKAEDKTVSKENSSSHDSSPIERVNFDIKV